MIPYDPAGPSATADPDRYAAQLRLDGPSETDRLGNDIAMALAPGDMVGLSGDLGAGKTALARAILRTLAGDGELEVPSPTFALAIPYLLGGLAAVHADLYRIGEEDIEELGLDDDPDAVLLVEWPERAPSLDRASRLTCRLTGAGESRDARIEAEGPIAGRLRRSFQVRRFLDAASMGGSRRQVLAGDASGRAFERLVGTGRLVMKTPPRSAAPSQDPYSVAARRAPSVDAFIAIDRLLRDRGFRAPLIARSDAEAGILLVEDLGDESIAPRGEPLPDRYLAVAECLAAKDAIEWPAEAPLDGGAYHIRAYDRSVLEVELSLYLDWGGDGRARPHEPAIREDFFARWRPHLEHLAARPRTLVLRDVHSPNILWQNDAEGLERIGLIDFQDALIGDPAYDLASLAQDARVTVAEDVEAAIVDRYAACRRAAGAALDEEDLRLAFAVLAAQRATKIIGIFRRLHRREGREGYLAHLPRVEAYLERNLAHPALADLRRWYREHGG